MIFQTLMNRLLRHTLSVLLAIITVISPCQAAVKFDGVNDYITVTKPSALVNQISVCLWAQWTTIGATTSTIQVLVDNNHSNTPNRGFIIQDRPDLASHLTFSTNPITAGVQSTTIVGDGSLHHICGSNDGTNSRLYVDGNLNASTPEIPNNNYQPNISVGHWLGGTRYLNGKVDDLRIYNRALLNGEVLAIYNSRSKRPSGSLSNGLVAHYEMDDDAIGEVTAQAKDSSGNLNHGQFIGFNNLTIAISNDVPAQIGAGHSLIFNGATSVVDLSSIPVQSHPLTLSFWAKPDTNNPIGMFDSAPNLGNVIRNYPAGVVEWWHLNPSVSLNLTANQWAHLSFVYYYDGNRHLSYYKDGILQQTVHGSNDGNLAWTSFRLGDINLGVHGKYQGKLDNFHIYNQALSASEISFLYNGSGLDPGTSNLQALWTFDDDSALKDSSGNNNHGAGIGGDSLKYSEGVLRR